MKRTAFLALLCSVLLFATSRIAIRKAVSYFPREIDVVVKNLDQAPMTDVRVHLGGKVLDLGTIPSNSADQGSIVPVADSNIQILYVDAQQQRRISIDTYVTGGPHGRVDIEIGGGGLVSCQEDFRAGPY